jgi:hypothetical protein
MHYEIYTIKGRKYKYSVQNFRTGNKVRHKKKYICPVEPLNKAQRKKGQGRKPEVFVRELTKEEKGLIDKATKSGIAFARDRARILIFSSRGIAAKDIAKISACEIRKVRTAIKSFNSKGISALQRGKAKGAIPKFDEIKKKIILMHFSKTPMSFDYHFTTWTLPRFAKHLIDYKIVDSISIEKVRQILDEAGARLKRSKRWQYSPDKDFHKKNLQ